MSSSSHRKQNGSDEMPLVVDLASTLTARQAKSRGCGLIDTTLIAGTLQSKDGDGNHSDVNLIAFGGNNGGSIDVATTVQAKGGSGHGDFESETFVVGFEDRARGDDGRGYGREPNFVADCAPTVNTVKPPAVVMAFDETQITHPESRSQPDDRSPQLAAHARPPTIAFDCRAAGDTALSIGDVPGTLRSQYSGHTAIAFQTRVARNGRGSESEVVPALNGAAAGATSDMRPCVAVLQPFTGTAVRRLTPRECERLQAYPDDYTLIKFRGKPAADGPRYKALGNSMCVADVRWILTRLGQVDSFLNGRTA